MRCASGILLALSLCGLSAAGESPAGEGDDDVLVIKAMMARFDAPSAEHAARRKLLEAIGTFGPKAKDTVPRLVKFLEDELKKNAGLPRYLTYEAAHNVHTVAGTLGKIGPAAAPAVKTLLVALKDIDGYQNENFMGVQKVGFVRRAAARALGQIGAREALIELRVSVMGDTEEDVRKAAQEAIKAIQAGPTRDATVGKVSGRVTYKGKPLPGGAVLFDCGKVKMRAQIDEAGHYTLADVPAGQARVAVDPQPAGKAPRVQLPARYSDPSRSGLVVTIARGGQTTYDINLED
jgi:hypothetical protein